MVVRVRGHGQLDRSMSAAYVTTSRPATLAHAQSAANAPLSVRLQLAAGLVLDVDALAF